MRLHRNELKLPKVPYKARYINKAIGDLINLPSRRKPHDLNQYYTEQKHGIQGNVYFCN